MRIQWLGHACFLLQTENTNIYIDPYLEPFVDYGELPKADLILVSQWTYSHATREGIEKVRNDNTAIWGSTQVAREIHGCIVLRPGQVLEGFDVKVHGMEAGVLPTSRREAVEDTVGFLIEAGGKKIYYTADSEVISAMVGVSADVLIVPVGGTHTIGPREAVAAVSAVRPKIVIPMHFGKIEGTMDDALLFKELVERQQLAEVRVLKPLEDTKV